MAETPSMVGFESSVCRIEPITNGFIVLWREPREGKARHHHPLTNCVRREEAYETEERHEYDVRKVWIRPGVRLLVDAMVLRLLRASFGPRSR